MKILVVGSGGREHAVCWKLAQSEKAEKIYWRAGQCGNRERCRVREYKGGGYRRDLPFRRGKRY